MKSMFAIAAASAALVACSGQQGSGNKSGNAAAPAANSAGANAASANAAAAPSGAPALAYQRYFNERWGRSGAAVTPAEVRAMLQSQTPRQTVTALYGTGENSRWDTVAIGIAKGEQAWLELAPQIARGTDAGTSDDFGIAVQDALTVNAAGALRLLTQIEMGVGACAENGFEVSAEQARTYFQTARAAVEAVNDPALQQIKTQCLDALRKGEAEYPGLNGNPPQKL